MLTSHRISAVSLAIVLAVCGAHSHAATITWGPATTVNNASDVATNGWYVDALHANPSQGDLTVGGVGGTVFHEQSASNVSGVLTATTTHITVQTSGPGGAGVNSTGGTFPASVTGTYLTVLSELDFGSNNLSSQFGTITLSGLSSGGTYQVQIWSIQVDTLGYVTTYTSGANSVSLHLNPGQFTLGTFIADAANQSLTFQSTAGPIYYAVNAVALRQLPEPGSLGIIACAGMLLAARRRKYRVSAVSSGVTYRLLPAVLLLGLFPSFGKAALQVVNVDLNGGSNDGTPATYATYTGQGVYTTADAHLWNALDLPNNGYSATVSTGSLFDSTGVGTAVQLTLTDVRFFNYVQGAPSFASGNALIDDIVYAQNSDHLVGGVFDGLYHSSFVVSGLTPGSAYSLILFGSSGTDPANTDFKVNGVVQTTTGRSSPSTPAIFTEGTDYTAFGSVVADGSGDITGFFKSGTGSPNGRLAGLQIINGPVPEPTSLGVIGCIGFGFIARRRK